MSERMTDERLAEIEATWTEHFESLKVEYGEIVREYLMSERMTDEFVEAIE